MPSRFHPWATHSLMVRSKVPSSTVDSSTTLYSSGRGLGGLLFFFFFEGIGSLQNSGGVECVVGEDQIGTRTFNRSENLEHDPRVVNPPVLRSSLDQGILAGHVVSRHRYVDQLLHAPDHIQVRER